MKQPIQSDDDFLGDVERAASEPHAVHLWWLGQSGFLIQWEGRHLLFDPYLSDSLTKKYAGTEKPHVRITERVVDPARLDFIDVVTSTHNHTDHLDAETLGPLLQANANLTLVIPEANRGFVAERLGIQVSRPLGLNDGRSADVDGFRIHGVPAAHEAVDRDEQGRCQYLGYVVECGEEGRTWTVYHSGDTVLYSGMVEKLSQWDIDLAILPINGSDPSRGVAGNLSGAEAARLARDIGARAVIPCHYDMFEFNTASPEPFVQECGRLGQHCVVLQNGERWTSVL